MDLIYIAVGVMFTAAALLTVYRIVRGPSILDRMIASDVLLTTLMLVVGTEMVYNGHTRTIPLMVVLASTAIFATIAVARYVSKQDTARGEALPLDSPVGESAAATTAPAAPEHSVGFEEGERP
jgi:multicomponent Na+:H+ antiporter subunit F